MSRVRFDLNKDVTIREFTKGLDRTSIRCEIDDKPTNFYPYFRIWFEDVKMVARTNSSEHVVRLVPVDALIEGHQQLAETIAALFGTTISVEDLSHWGSGIPWARALWEQQQ